MKKLKLFMAAFALILGWSNASADVSLSPFANAAGEWGGTGGVTNGVYLVERYFGDSRPTGQIMAQSVSSVPNGTYDVVVIAHACHANGVGGGFVASNNTLSVNGSSKTVATIDNSDVAALPMTEYTFSNVSVTDGTMTIKLSADEAGANWFTIRAVSVTLKGSYTDYTNKLTNTEFSSNVDGWNAVAFVYHASGDGFSGGFAEMWRGDAATMEAGSIHQTAAGLPAGTYMLSANMRARRVTGYLYASIGGKEQKHAYIGNDNVGVRALTFVVKETSDVEIGFKHNGNATTGKGDKWVAIDDIKITRLGDVGETSLTSQIGNPSFETGDLSLWTSNDMGTASNMSFSKLQGHIYAEKWHSAGEKSVKQTLSGLPSGKFKLTATATAGGGTDVKVYAGSQETSVGDAGDYNVNFICDGSDVEIGYVGTGTASSWLCTDNFRLTYYGPAIGSEAVALPVGDMTAGKWYYFDIAIDGTYDLTLTTLADIVYTQDGTILIANESSVTTNFSGTDAIALTAGRYYVKSSSAQTLAVAAHSFSYELGTATLSATDGSETQSQIFTVTFPDASDNDPDTELELVAGSKATVNGNAVDLVATTKGFTIDLGSLTTETNYAISIPANVYGYVGHDMNSAISLTLHTPVVFDGTYYLYDETNKLFVSCGANYGSRATVDKYGIPVIWDNSTKMLSLKNHQAVNFFFDAADHTNCWIYTDGNSGKGNDRKFEFKSNGAGKYYLQDYAKAVYITHNNSVFTVPTTTVGSAAVWTILTKSERDAIVAAYPNANKSNVITAAGISTTAAEFETYLSNNYTAVDKTSEIGTATFSDSKGDWTWTQQRGRDGQPAYSTNGCEIYEATGTFSQSISGLDEGIYKVTVQGFERAGGWSTCNTLGAEGYEIVTAYLGANNERTQLKSWYSDKTDTNNPNWPADVATKFSENKYINEVYVYVDDSGNLELELAKPSFQGDNWLFFNNFTLTYYAPVEKVTVGSSGFATYVPSSDLDFSATSIEAYKVKVGEKGVATLTKVDNVPAGTPVLLYKEGGATEDIPVMTGAATVTENDLVAGTGAAVATTDGDYTNMILNNVDGIGFYFANGQTVAANRAYLHIASTLAPDPVNNARMAMRFAGAITSIDNVEAAAEATLKDGKYLENGKLVIVKAGKKFNANGAQMK